MRYLYRAIVVSLFLCSSSTYAMDFFADALYWQASEPIDWALVNSRSVPHQNITYKTISFDSEPGFRIGLGADEKTWDTQFYYTKYYTNAKASASGNLLSAFLGGTIARPNNDYFFQTGQASFTINFNMFDWDFGKRFYVANRLTLHPLVGLKGGWIDQSANTKFQGPVSVAENTKNNFAGIGPKAGIEAELALLQSKNSEVNLIADFETSYLWGNWTIDDVLHDTIPKTVNIKVANRDYGALAFRALVGANFNYKNFSMKLGYEMNDWLNQYQIFDDATGGHHNDLMLQGVTLQLAYHF